MKTDAAAKKMQVHYLVQQSSKHLVSALFSILQLRKHYDAEIVVHHNLDLRQAGNRHGLARIESDGRATIKAVRLNMHTEQVWLKYLNYFVQNFTDYGVPVVYNITFTFWLRSPELLTEYADVWDVALPVDSYKVNCRRDVCGDPVEYDDDLDRHLEALRAQTFFNRYGFAFDNWLAVVGTKTRARDYLEHIRSAVHRGDCSGPSTQSHEPWRYERNTAAEERETDFLVKTGCIVRPIPRHLAYQPPIKLEMQSMDRGSVEPDAPGWQGKAGESVLGDVPASMVVLNLYKDAANKFAKQLDADLLRECWKFADRVGAGSTVRALNTIF